MMRWPIRLGRWFNRRGFPFKGIRLIKTTEPIREDRGGFVLILHGAYNRLVGREIEQPGDAININELNATSSPLNEDQQATDSINTATRSREQRSMTEVQSMTDSTQVEGYSALEVQRFEKQNTTEDFSYNQYGYEVKEFGPTSGGESQSSSDSISHSSATLTSVSLSESQTSEDSYGTNEATREVWRYRDMQWQHEISTAYVPSGSETLQISPLSETSYPYDGISVTVTQVDKFVNLYGGIANTSLAKSDPSTYYYYDYVIWTGTENASLYGGVASSAAYASIVRIDGGLAGTKAYSGIIKLGGGLTSIKDLSTVATIYEYNYEVLYEVVGVGGGLANTTVKTTVGVKLGGGLANTTGILPISSQLKGGLAWTIFGNQSVYYYYDYTLS